MQSEHIADKSIQSSHKPLLIIIYNIPDTNTKASRCKAQDDEMGYGHIRPHNVKH